MKKKSKKQKELEMLIKSYDDLKNRDCLSKIGIEYLKGLRAAHKIIFKCQID